MLKDDYGNEAKYANLYGWTDINPYEIVRVISDKTIEIRAMKAERDETVKLDWAVGGFAGVLKNIDEVKWNIEPEPENPVIRARLNKGGYWKTKYGKHYLAAKPTKFYDYNF